MACLQQNKAQIDYILAIIKENGYYEWLRLFMKNKGYDYESMAVMLSNSYNKNAPDGMSIYYFMDSLEDAGIKMDMNDINDINDMVDFVWDHELWKES